MNILTYREWWRKVKVARWSGLGLVGFGSEDLQLSSRLLVGKFVPTLPPTNFPIISLVLSDILILFLSFLYRVCSGLRMMKVQVHRSAYFSLWSSGFFKNFLFIFFTCEVRLQVLSCLFSFSSEGNRLLCCWAGGGPGLWLLGCYTGPTSLGRLSILFCCVVLEGSWKYRFYRSLRS